MKDTLETFAQDMEKISHMAILFFEKYEQGGSGVDFAKDFGMLIAKLGTRIRREEERSPFMVLT